MWRRGSLLLVGLMALAIAAGATACGGGGGGGAPPPELELLEETTFLLKDDGPDPRTAQLVKFILRELSNPDDLLTDDDVEVRRGGSVDVEARVRVNPLDIEKNQVTLVLDVSSSLTPADLEAVKESAKDFADDVLPLAGRLRIYYFSSPTETHFLGQYDAETDDGELVWNPDPAPAIDAIPGGVNSTALFNAVRLALIGDEENDDIFVVFSDGQENSSPAGAREEAINMITDERIVVFSIGFGSVESADLQALSEPFGSFLGVRPSLVGLFAEVGRLIESVYSVVYDSPVSFGTQDLDFRISVGRSVLSHETTIEAGVDYARSAFSRYPSLPGSVVQLANLRPDPDQIHEFTVRPLANAVEGPDGLFAFAIAPTHVCPAADCTIAYQGPYGQGALSDTGGVYLPSELVVGMTWDDAVTGGEFMFTGFEVLDFFVGSPDELQLECARVTFDGGTHWFAREIGLVRTRDDADELLLELAAPPCLSSSFSGGCPMD